MKDYSLKINGYNYDVQIDSVNETSTVAHVVVNGKPYEVEILGAKAPNSAARPHVAPAPASLDSAQVTPVTVGASAAPKTMAAAAPAAGAIKSPLPGTVLAVKVAVGDSVKAGQTLVVLEAMKMENNIDADREGTVTQILVQQGATVQEGDSIIVIG